MFGVFFAYIFGVIFVLFISIRFVHMLQLESYQNNMFNKWILDNVVKGDLLIINLASLVIAGLIATLFYGAGIYNLDWLFWLLALCVCGFSFFSYYKTPKKKPLVITERVKRLLISLTVVTAVLLFFASYVFEALYVVIFVSFVLAPYLVLVANVVVSPVEKLIQHNFLSEAKSILANRNDLIVIGVTGSYGKTSTKFILNTLLNEKYNSVCSPASYNTPMGLTKVIREMLTDEHEVFIAEMGARYRNDIKELCDLVHPQYGIISSIGKQHLETFKSLDNIINTKFDLIRSLPADGIGYLPNDGDICTKLAEEKDGYNKKVYSLSKTPTAFVYAENVVHDENGCGFDIVFNDKVDEAAIENKTDDKKTGDKKTKGKKTKSKKEKNDNKITVRTCLLGEHNVQNILGAVALAKDLGLSAEQIKAGVEKIKPIEHRLQLIKNPNNITIIDDAFNANPAGTKMALKVISDFKGNKIIVTPGLVELGDETAELNKQFGRDIAEHCDVAVLVGKKFTGYIKEGLQEAGFDMGAVVEYDSLDEVSGFIGAYAKPGDVVLFENDLPDNYL